MLSTFVVNVQVSKNNDSPLNTVGPDVNFEQNTYHSNCHRFNYDYFKCFLGHACDKKITKYSVNERPQNSTLQI